MGFSKLAQVYSRFNDESAYFDWITFVEQSLDKRPYTLLDLACGTGVLTEMMGALADEIIGIDLSPEMIFQAQETLVHPYSNVSFRVADMTQSSAYQWVEGYDVITCFLDSLCFLEDETQLSQTFHQVYQHLSERGQFLFDVWTPYHIRYGFNGFEYFDYDESAALLWESYPTEALEEIVVEHDLTLFIQKNGNLYERTNITLVERSYPLEVYMHHLTEAGFAQDDIQVYVNHGREIYDPSRHHETPRWFFRCYK